MKHLPRECFQPALQRLDLLLHREILRLRASYQLSLDEFRGLYVSDSQVDALIRQWSDAEQHHDSIENLHRLIDEYDHESRKALASDPQWNHLVEQFQLNPMEQDVVILALAPELALKYETLYAYLNNDVTRKFPTVDLALRLAAAGRQTACRRAFSPAGTLVRAQILEPVNDLSERWSLSAGFRLAPSVHSYLWDGVPLDARLIPGSQFFPLKTASAASLDSLNPLPTVVGNEVSVLEGEPGAGRLQAVQQCLSASGRSVLVADLSALAIARESLSDQLLRLLMQARLGNAGLLLNGVDKLMRAEDNERRQASAALMQLSCVPVPVYLCVASGAPWREWLAGIRCTVLAFSDPDVAQRVQLWQSGLANQGLSAASDDVHSVADRFVLNPGQIAAAVATVAAAQRTAAKVPASIAPHSLLSAAREQSVGDIGKLANKVCTSYRWEDLILPRSTAERVQEAIAAIINRGLVYQQWQMCQRTGGSSGLMMMFSGTSGTGKTMCASLIAQAVGFDLYCIDLSSVVSKYIGDTEKNLDRIFTAARRANCILFFDEADALLGKRSEVKDAHDRYANVEVAYLLQKMEQHDGVVIMATNIAKNIDSAFSRRLHYTIEFPRPNAEHRERLWRGMFPPQAPLAEDVDFTFLSRHFEGTGGDIKTIALDAAMQAAGNGQCINMQCLVRAMARQLIKQGKAPCAADFKQYFPLLENSMDPRNAVSRQVIRHTSAAANQS